MGIDIKEYLTPPVLLVLFLVIVSLMIIFPVLNMIILGAILAYGVKPVARKIQSKLKFNSLSILLAMVVVLIPLILLIAYIVIELIAILSGASSSSTYADINALFSSISAYLPWSFDVNSISTSVNSSIQEIGRYVLNYLVKFISSLMNITLDLFILVCSVFYFVRDGDDFLEFMRSFLRTLPDISDNWNIRSDRIFTSRISIWNLFRCNNWYSAAYSSIWPMAYLLGIVLYGHSFRKLSEGYCCPAFRIFPKHNRHVHKAGSLKPLC